MRTFDFTQGNVFDQWRELYPTLTSEEQAWFYNALEQMYPHQQSFTLETWLHFFTRFTKEGDRVIEIGGWKGELAASILANFSHLKSWTNIEICQSAIDKTACVDPRYRAVNPGSFTWFESFDFSNYDVAIASHVIEHLADDDLVQLLTEIDTRVIALEAPIGRGESDWKGYQGSHILKMGWDKTDEIMRWLGWTPIPEQHYFRIYE